MSLEKSNLNKLSDDVTLVFVDRIEELFDASEQDVLLLLLLLHLPLGRLARDELPLEVVQLLLSRHRRALQLVQTLLVATDRLHLASRRV